MAERAVAARHSNRPLSSASGYARWLNAAHRKITSRPRLGSRRTPCRSISRLNSKPASRKQSFRSGPSFSIRSLVAAGSGTIAPARPWRFSTRKPAWGGKKRAFICTAKLTQIQTPPSKHSLADLIASLPERERRRRLRRVPEDQREALRWDWRYWGRLEQQSPPGDWRTWLLLAGRGFGIPGPALNLRREIEKRGRTRAVGSTHRSRRGRRDDRRRERRAGGQPAMGSGSVRR